MRSCVVARAHGEGVGEDGVSAAEALTDHLHFAGIDGSTRPRSRQRWIGRRCDGGAEPMRSGDSGAVKVDRNLVDDELFSGSGGHRNAHRFSEPIRVGDVVAVRPPLHLNHDAGLQRFRSIAQRLRRREKFA